ncbi:hypothetical protein CAP35_12335 [Chitinophagaceae bacterium IBVUCB1]|nr:hypothetical protein CAP35_12335 [Chitinophagaceae bacterium IBVUCB1]
MKKTLLKHFTENTTEKQQGMMNHEADNDALTDLVQEMKHYLHEARTDLLSPRPELMAQLFSKVLH